MTKFAGPTFRYGPNGEAKIFHDTDDVPEGWQDSPQKAKAMAEAAPAPKPAVARPVRDKSPALQTPSVPDAAAATAALTTAPRRPVRLNAPTE